MGGDVVGETTNVISMERISNTQIPLMKVRGFFMFTSN